MYSKEIKIGDVDFKWGMEISDLKSVLTEDLYSEYEDENVLDKKILRVKINEFCGLQFCSCDFLAVDSDRLINRIIFNLKEVDKDTDATLEQLDKIFGQRISNKFVDKDFYSTLVTRSSAWDFGNCKIGMDFYNKGYEEFGELSYGTLIFSFENIELIHDLYALEWIKRTETLEKKFTF